MNIPWKLLKLYVQGNIKEYEINELGRWRKSSEVNNKIFEEVMADRSFKKKLIDGKWDNKTEHWEKIESRIIPANPEFHVRKNIFYLAGIISTAILLLIGLSLGILYERNIPEPILNEEYTYIFSPRGQHTQVILPDETKVWLNAESSLRYSTNFNNKTREVYLVGEGFFEVSKNSDKPFYVNAGEVEVLVYGTSFNVKAFPEDQYIETTLIEGSLSVIPVGLKGKSDTEIMLQPNEKCIYQKTNNSEILNPIKNAAPNNLSSDLLTIPRNDIPNMALAKNAYIEPEKNWKDGKLIFKNETFGELEIKLERWFDINIHFEDDIIKEYRFTGVFDKETINEAMEALKLSSQGSYEYEIQFSEVYLK